MTNESEVPPQITAESHRALKILYAVVFGITIGLGISIGYTQRTPEFYPVTSQSSVINSSRILTLATDLLSVDATTGTMTIAWSVVDDTACNEAWSPPCPGVSTNSTVDLYFDANVLTQTLSSDLSPPSDNIPDTPIFRHNATAVASQSTRNALAVFRTQLALFSVERGRSTLSTLQMYPFDQYSAQIFIFGIDSQTSDLIGLRIGPSHGIAVGFKATALPTPLRGYSGVIAEVVTVSRSPLVQAYVIVIVMAVWLITLMFMFATASVLCGYELDPGVLVVPVATLFAITQLRSSMPGAPEGFGAIIDFVGLLPCLAFTSFSASLTIGALIFSPKSLRPVKLWQDLYRKIRLQKKDDSKV